MQKNELCRTNVRKTCSINVGKKTQTLQAICDGSHLWLSLTHTVAILMKFATLLNEKMNLRTKSKQDLNNNYRENNLIASPADGPRYRAYNII